MYGTLAALRWKWSLTAPWLVLSLDTTTCTKSQTVRRKEEGKKVRESDGKRIRRAEEPKGQRVS